MILSIVRLSFLCLLLVLGGTDSWGMEDIFYNFEDGNNSSLRAPSLRFQLMQDDDLDDDLDDDFAYANLLHTLNHEVESDHEGKEVIELVDRFVQGRAEISDRIDVLSGLSQLKREERANFCRKVLNLPSHDKIPGWIIYRLSQCDFEEQSKFFHNLDLWFQQNKKMFPFPKVEISQEEITFQTILQLFHKAL